MLKRIFGILLEHIVHNFVVYGLCTSFLVTGIIVGWVYGLKFDDGGFFSGFFSNITEYSASDYVNEGFLISLVLAISIFFFGISPTGCIVFPVLIGYKGFVTGYTIAAFFATYGIKTFVFVLVGMLPSAVFWLPVYLFTCVNGIRTSYCFLKMMSRRPVNDPSSRAGELAVSCIIFFFGVVLSKFTEIFIIPQMLNIVGGLYA